MEEIREIKLGGIKSKDEERIYFKDASFSMPDGTNVVVEKSHIEAADMPALFARHMARYYQVGVFCRPNYKLLDFPCGTGYASEIFAPFNVQYEGLDFDATTVEYAKQVYGKTGASFSVGDLKNPNIEKNSYDVIACIEGLEHIEMQYQDALIKAFEAGLRSGGTLIISSPENPNNTSGQSTHNPWHVGELTREDFLALLKRHFPEDKVELVTCPAKLSSGVTTNMFLGICHKE